MAQRKYVPSYEVLLVQAMPAFLVGIVNARQLRNPGRARARPGDADGPLSGLLGFGAFRTFEKTQGVDGKAIKPAS